MNDRQQAIHESLGRINPELAGLFAFGCELVSRLNEPGSVSLLGHAGRELSNGVLRYLAKQEGFDLLPRDTTAGGGRHAAEIGAALGVDVDHPLVREWMRIHGELVGGTHYAHGGPAPSASAMNSAFDELGAYLYGRIGPYFDSQEELFPFLTIGDPSESDLTTLMPLLAHPQHRRYFFANLTNAKWLKLAKVARLYGVIPGRKIFPDGKWAMREWPEGEALVRLADQVPDLAAEVFENVPDNCDNPLVWKLIAEASQALPTPLARRLIPRLRRALRTDYKYLFPHVIVRVTARFAEEKDEAAFLLAESLTYIRNSRGIPEFGGTEDEQENARETWARKEPLSTVFEPYEYWEMLEKITPSLEALDAPRLFTLLIGRLRKALRIQTAEMGRERSSQYWCDTLESADGGDELPTQLAVAATAVACRSIKGNPAISETLLAELPKSGSDIWYRIGIVLVTCAGSAQQEAIDALVADPEILDPPFGARETAALLRQAFIDTLPDVQESFLRNLDAGPSYYQSNIAAARTEEDRALVEQSKLAWQRRALRWFRDSIPPRLLPMARKLGVDGTMPSYEQRELDEVGHFSSNVASYGGPDSPVTLEEIRKLSPGDLVALLSKWESKPYAFHEPSAEGLSRTLSDLLAEWPASGPEIIQACLDSHVLPIYIAGLQAGVRRALETRLAVPWDVVKTLGWTPLQQADASGRGDGGPVESMQWQRGARDFLAMIEAGAVARAFPLDNVADIAQTLGELASDRRLHEEEGGRIRRSLRSFDQVLNAARISLVGHLLQCSVAVGEWAKRVGTSSGAPTPDLHWLSQVFDISLAASGESAVWVQSEAGRLLNRLRYLVPDWVRNHAETLFAEGMSDAMAHPAWGTYLNGLIYLDAVQLFRASYVAGVGELEALTEREAAHVGDRDSRLSRRFLLHVLWGYLSGIFDLDEPERIVERTFAGTRAEDHDHAYWAVFRQWTDAAEARSQGKETSNVPTQDQIDRLVRLWEWRLGQLEAALSANPKDENALADADALGWMLRTPFIPDSELLRLAVRTLKLAPAKGLLRRSFWPRLGELAMVSLPETLVLGELLLRMELSADHVSVDFNEVAPILRLGLRSPDPAAKQKVRGLINELGARGLQEYGALLKEVG